MLVFHGGLTVEQVEKLKSGSPIIYEKVPYDKVRANGKNTFDFIPKELIGKLLHIFRKYVSEDCYSKQYIFLLDIYQQHLNFVIILIKRIISWYVISVKIY